MLVMFCFLGNLSNVNSISNIDFLFEVILICVHVQRFETFVTSAI